MTAIDLKTRLIGKISETDDVELLDQISRLIDLEEQIEDVYILSPEEMSAVKKGIDQIESGLFLTNKEANRRADQCLGK